MAKKDILQRAKEIRAQRAQDNLQGVDVTAENDVLARAKQIRAARRGEETPSPTPVEDTAKIEEARKEYNERQATLDKMDTQRTISGIINRGLGREAEETHSMFNSLGRSIGVRDDIDYEMMAKRQQPLLDYLTTGETEHSWRMPLYNEIGTENLADIDKPIVDEQYIPRGEELIKLVGKNSGATDRTRNYGMDDHLRAGYMLHPERVETTNVLVPWSDAHPAPVEPIMRPSKDGLYHIGDETYTEDEMQNALTALIPMAQHGRRMDLNPHYRDAFAYELYGKNFNDAYYGEMDKLLAELDRLEANIAERTRAKSQQYVETYSRPVNARATTNFVSQSGANSSADNLLYIERAKDYVNSLKDNSFKAGLKEGFDLYDFATAGISGLFQEGQLKRILDKANSGKLLTDEERTMYEVWGIMQEADALQQTFYRPEPSFWNKVGRGVGESAEMLPSFALGMGSVEAIGAKSIGLAGLKQIARKQGMKGLAKHTFNRAGVYGLRAGAATPASPMMWSNYMKRRNDQYSIVDGNLVKRETSALGDLGIAYVETFNEYYSEMLGGGASKLIDISPSMFGRLINIDKWGGKMGLGKAMDYVNSVIPSDKVRNTMINMGFSGPLTEAPSEAIGDLMTNAMLAPFSDEYGFEHFKDPDYYKELLMTTTIFGGGMGVFSVGSQISNVREVNKAIKKRDYAMSKINDESLANSLKGVMALDSIDEMSNALVALHLETLPADQAAAAIEYIANATQVKVGTAEMMEETRMSQFADVVKRFEGFTYQGKDGTMPSDRIVAVKDKKSGEVYYVTRGDFDANSDVHMLKVKNAQGEDMSVLSSAVEYLDETTLDTRLIDVYENMYGADIAAERIAEVEGAVRSMENPTREDIRAHYMRNGFQVYNNGSEVTLVDGRKAIVEGMLDNGHYLVRSVNPATQMDELFDIPFMQVLQTNDAVAKGQQKYFNDNVNEVAEDIAKEETATEATENTAETTTEENATEDAVEEQVTEDMPKELPMREDGSVDLDAITDVKTFAEQFTLASGGVQQAIESVKTMAARARKSAEELREKSKTLINANEVVDANKKAAALEERANFYDSVVAEMDTEAVETPATDVEETTPVEFKEGDLVEHNGRGARILEIENGEAILDYSMQDGIVNRGKMEIGKAPVSELKPLAEDTTAEDVTEEAVEDAVEEEIEKAENGVVDNIYAKLLPKKMRNVLDTMAKNLGVKVVFAEEVITAAGTHANADVRGNVVRIAWGNRGKSIDFLAGHEFLHRMKDMGPEAYEEFKQSVINYLGEAEWNRRIGKMQAVYESHNKRAALKGKPLLSYSEALLEEEVVADVAGELVGSHHAFDIYVNKQQGNISLLDKVRKVLRAISDYIRRLGARTEAQRVNEMVGKLNTLIDRAMTEAKKNGVNLSNEQMFSLESQPIFYSNAEYAVRGIKQEKATPEQWLKMIEKNGGLKAGEDKWLGLSDWLKASDKKTLTKDEVLQYIAENDIQIEEVSYGDVADISREEIYESAEFAELREGLTEYDDDDNPYINRERYDELRSESYDFVDGFSLDYWGKELEVDSPAAAATYLGLTKADKEINETRLNYTTQGLSNKREIALVVPTIEPWNTSDNIHFGDAGEGRAVAWIRFGETTDADGKRVLVIDEIQSKRHQEGREKGYRDVEAEKREKAERERELTEVVLPRLAELNQLYNEKYGVGKWRDTEYDRQWRPRRVYRFLTPEEQAEHESLSIRATELQTTMPRRDGIPSAPFEKNWAELAMKRMLRYAAENGFDKVAWTTGDQQAERYDLGAKIDHIRVTPSTERRYVEISPIRGRAYATPTAPDSDIIVGGEFKGKSLSEVYGKALAEKIMSVEVGGDERIAGDGLRIGGEGMKAFYDQMLPSFVRKYAKKWGATVGEVTMPGLEENNTMHSVDVTPAMREGVMQGQPKFSLQGSDKSLVGLHNISLDKLRKAIKMGGLANPSVAVIDVDKATHEDYGDYTLVLTSNMVDARLGRNAGTWAGDAWTPTYPQVVKRIAMSKDITRFHKDISKMPEAMRNRVRLQLNSFLEDRPADSFAYWYLFEKGVAPEMAVIPPVFPDDIVKMVSEATDGTFNMWQKSDEQKARCVDAYIAYKYDGDRAAYEADLQNRKERLQRALNTTKSQLVAKKAAGDLATLEEFGFDYDAVSTFLREVDTDNSRRGQSDVQGTIRLAEDYIKDNNLEEDYQSWRDSLEGRYGIKEYIFDGYTDSGNQRWLPHTTANASKWMKKQGREGATDTFPSFGLFVAKVIPRMTTLNTIRKRKGHLGRPGQEYEAFKEKWENVYFELGQKLQPDAERFEDYGWWRLIEAVSTNNPKEHIKKQYGIELSDEDMQKLNDMLDAIKSNYPARYFETKFERPVELSEFIAAVVPNDIPADVEASLQDAYLNIYKYDKGVEGSRQEAVLEATDSPSVRFSLMEKPENEARYSISATDMAEIEAERKSIIETAKANGTYLKAPNGKDTNLTPEQWVNVRTKRFKAWFGDWELAEIAEYLMSDDVVAILSGEEFVKDGIPLTKKVSEFYEDNYNGKVTRKGLGEVILDKRSVKDSTIHGFGKAKTAAFAAVPNIITEGRIIDEQKNWKGRNYDSVTIAAPIRIGGSNYVGIVIVRKGQGTNSNRFYLHEVVLQENLQDESFKTDTKADSHRGDIAKVMQKIFISKENSSKVIDENGEPKVVYHFTKGKFTTFSYDYFGKGNDMGNSGKAFYFTPDSDTIFDMAGSIKMPVFLNIRNPYYSYWGVSENELIEGLSKAAVFNRTKEELIAAINGMQEDGEVDEDTAKEAITAIENMPQEEYEEINSKDGVIAISPRGPIFEYAVKYPNQIKSADPVTYDDNGNVIPLSERFNPEKEDIRYSLEEIIDTPSDDEYKTQMLALAQQMERDAESRGLDVAQEIADTTGWVHLDDGTWKYYGDVDITEDAAERTAVRRWLESKAAVKKSRTRKMYDDLIKEQKKVVSEMETESKDRRNNSNYGKAVDAILQGQAQESLPIEDQILVDIALGQKLRWEDEKDGKRRGLKSKLGLRSAKAEGMRGVTGGNTYVEDYVAAVMERNNGYENDIDDNDVRNAVIEVFGSYPSRKAALEELSRRYPDAAINEATEALNRLEYERNEALAQIDADLREELADAEANPDKYERAYEEESSWNAQFDIYTGALQKARNEVARMERNLSNARLSQREKSAAMRAMKKAVTEMLRGDLGRYTRKRDIQALMNAVNEAQTTYSMMRAIDKAMMTINELRLRKEEARMHNLLKMRIVLNETNLDPHTFLNNMVRSGQMTPAVARRVLDNYWRGINSSGIPVAKGVDGDTAKVMDFISYWSNLDTFLAETGVGEEGIDAAIETIWRELNGEAVEKPIITRYDNVTAEEVTDTQRKFQGWSKASPEQRGEIAKAVGLIHGYLQVQQAIRNMNRESGTLAIEEDISKERKAIKELHKKIEELKGEKVVVDDETIKDAEKQIREHEKAIDSLLRVRLNARIKSAGKYNAGMPMVVEQLYQLNSAVEDLLHSGKINLQHFRGAQQEHQRELINMALEDIDKPQDETKHKHDYTAMQKIQAAWPVRYFRKHLPSMEHMLRRMGRNSVDGEGKVFNYFLTNLMRAHNRIFEETAKCNEMLTAKTEALFGEGMTYNRVMRKAERKVIGTVTERNGNDVAVQEYTIANALYTIAMWEQPIGRATLVKQGITEGVIKDLRARLKEDNPAWLEFERWVVDDFLPSRRVKYNAVYREMNGTDMGFEVNYFPIRRREPKKYQSVDLASPSFENKPSTMTGALIERTDNVMPIDIESSFFGVLKDNITEMEQWSEMAPVTRDFNLMLSSPRVKAAMDAIDEHFYEDFSEAAKVATLNYTGDQKKEDDILMQVALRMWGASKLAWKMYTALKQVTSGVLALPYSADPKFLGRLVWYASGGKGMVSDAVLEKIGRGDLAVKEPGEPLLNIQWAIKNSPMFKRRWQSGVAGNDIFTRELKYEDHTKGKRAIRDISQGLDWFAQLGMKPIAFVDACTVATIMRTVYDYEREALLADGYSEEEANEKAMFRAELFANKTQQSSETEYLSPLQMERGVTSMITIFQNAPFAQGRMMADAWNELTRDIDAEIATATTQEYKNLREHKYAEDIKAVEDTIAKEKKAGVITNNEEETMRRDQLMRPLNEKIREEAATRAAKRISNAKFKAVRTFIYNGWLGQAVFNISGYLPYLIFGDDDEKKKVMLKDWAKMSMLGPIGTVPLGSALLSAINGHQLSLLGAYAELEEGVNDIAKYIREGEWSEVLFTVGDFLFNKLAGVDYKTWLNAWAGIENMFEAGMSAEAMLRAMNAPESQMRLLIGDRKEGETFEQYTTRIMCMYTTIFSNAEYGYYFDKDKRKKNVDAPFGMTEKQMNEMHKTYDKAYRANVVSTKGGAQEWANTVAVDKAYTEAVETLGWKANTKPKVKGQRAYDIEKKKYYLVDAPIEGMTIEEYNTLVSLGNAVAIAARNAEKYLGQDDETYLEYVRAEVEAKREFMAEYNKIIDK